MTHDELVAEVTSLCDRLGLLWHYAKTYRPGMGRPGFPDLVIAGYRGVIFAELKTEDGDTTAQQDLWLHRLAMGGSLMSRVFVWKPADLEAGRIANWLSIIAK